jgi:hypothetical protein
MKYFVICFLAFCYCVKAEILSNGVLSHESGWYTKGSEINLNATPDSFSAFENWSIDGVINTNESISFVVTNSMTILANFNLLTTSNNIPYIWFNLINENWTNNFNERELTDYDGDGFTAMQEFIAGTNPNDPNSFFHISEFLNNNGELILNWNHYLFPNQIVYVHIYKSDNLTDWVKIHTKQAQNGLNNFSINNSELKTFYKIKAGLN